ncbi:MAG: O-antigen ligase family protein [Ignavibacteriae bacterium]|nr:O-antigen ligase family protein [Ignavibacteriota bacterium]
MVLGTLDRKLEAALWICVAATLATLIFSTALSQAGASLSVLLWIGLAARGRVTYPPRMLVVPFTALYLTRAASIVFSVVPDESVRLLYTETVFGIFFFAVYSVLASRTEARSILLLRILTAAGAVAALVGLARYIFVEATRITSTTSGYYTLGMFLLVVLLLLLAVGPSKRLLPHPALWWISSGLMFAGIVFTQNRIHMALAGVAVLGFSLRRSPWMALVFVALAAGLYFASPDFLRQAGERSMAPGAMSGREVLWSTAWDMAGDRPLTGYGPRSFRSIFPRFDDLADKGVGSWHNDAIQAYMDSGAMALAAMLALYAAAFVGFVRAWRRTRDGHTRDVLLGSAAAIAAYLLAGGIFDVLLSLLFFTVLAIAAAAAPPLDADARTTSSEAA